MPEAEPVECVVDRREPGEDAGAARDLGLELGEGEIRGRLDQGHDLTFVRLQQRPAMAAVAGRRRAAGRAHPLHQLDRHRRADGEPARGFANRAASLDRPHDPPPQVQGAGIMNSRLWSQPILSNHRHRFYAIGICSRVGFEDLQAPPRGMSQASKEHTCEIWRSRLQSKSCCPDGSVDAVCAWAGVFSRRTVDATDVWRKASITLGTILLNLVLADGCQRRTTRRSWSYTLRGGLV